jgi:hypothetical protein
MHFLVVVDFIMIESVEGVPLRRVSRHIGRDVSEGFLHVKSCSRAGSMLSVTSAADPVDPRL